MRKTAAAVLWAVLAFPAWAQAPALPREADADVDGDAKPERIVLEGTRDFVLRAGGAEARSSVTGRVLGLELLDLDEPSTGKEVLVHAESPERSPEVQLFRWKGGALERVPLPPGKPQASGSGIVLFDVPMGFWSRRDKYTYDADKPGFSEVPQGLYFIHGERNVFLPRETPLVSEPGGVLLLPLPAHTNPQLIAFAPDPGARRESASSGWYLVEVDRLVGWVRGDALTLNKPENRVDMWLDRDTSLYDVYSDTDLDGDGLGDSVSLERPEGTSPGALLIGNHRVKLPAHPDTKLQGVDLDFTDKYREVFLQGKEESRLVRFEGGAPRVVALPECDEYFFRGDNALMCVGREYQEHKGGTVQRNRYFVFDTKQETFRERPQSLYTHYVPELDVKKTFPLLRSREPKAPVVARLAADSTIEVLVKSASDGHGRNWFLVRSQTGLLGWAEVDTVFKNVSPRRDDFEP
ncbi:hypothetical protein ATI61_11990 [Archangium gephyra]|uniref:SH3 domain-containing protein n=1 Tax=Archangium gephyra TaxID=48 RepID=A0AAC8TFA0_9BACT|nr:hypothetical protein [Archangium gephyra]AKJ03660.1 Hypothetical protein AA314_05286 [Archangium gephyra]REG22560.1 hypothetical protein ATI61_11990 [Archangium gephyra]